MKGARTDGLGGNGVTYLPSSEQYSNVVIWLHGLGDTADGWASLMPELKLENTKFILPTADVRPISLNGGMAMPGWSDIYGLDIDSHEDSNGFEQSSDRVSRIIQKEIESNNIDPSNIVVAGFSQGGAVALHNALRSPHNLGGCIALSSWVPLRGDYPDALGPHAKKLRVLQVHGDEDMVVSYKWGQMAHQLLKSLVSEEKPHFITITGMGHSSDPEEITAVRKFLRSVFNMEN